LTIRTGIYVALLVLVPLGVYWQTVFHEYGYRDDYAHLRETREEPGKLVGLTASQGRPLHGALLEVSVKPIGQVSNLGWVRLLGTLLLIGAALALFRELARSGWTGLEAGAAALGVALLPSAQITIGWAISWPNALALAFSVLGFGAVETALGTPRLTRVIAWMAGIFCYLVAALTYPSNMLFAVVPLAGVLLVRSDAERLRHARWAAYHLATLFGALVLAFLVMNLVFALGVFPEHGRLEFESRPLSKLWWFLRQPISNALGLYALRDDFDTGAVAFWTTVALVVAVIGAGFLSDRVRERSQRAKWLFVVIFLPLVAHAVSLVAYERSVGYRTIFPLAGLAVVLVVYSVRALRIAGRINPVVHAGALGAMIAIGAIAANRNAFELIAEPHYREWRIVRDAAEQLRPTSVPADVFVIMATRNYRSTKRVFTDEFGSFSSNSEWSPIEMFKAALRARFPDGAPEVRVALGYELPANRHYDLVVDLRKLAAFRDPRDGRLPDEVDPAVSAGR
jgi:hypothetical protein